MIRCFLFLILPVVFVHAFCAHQSKDIRLMRLFESPDNDHVKKSGGGIPIVPSGNNELSGSIFDRINKGTSYEQDEDPTTEPVNLLDSSSSEVYEQQQPEPEDPVITPTPEPTFIPSPDEWEDCQHWLEDIEIQEPSQVTASVLDRYSLADDIQHVVLQLPFHYQEGQCLRVMHQGESHLYSIASTRYGDDLEGDSASLCVSVDGPCGDYLSNLQVGDSVQVEGPFNSAMVLDTSRDLIMVASGTGISPFRAFSRRLFAENTVTAHLFNNAAWLIFDVPTTLSILYGAEWDTMERLSQGQLRVDYAISQRHVSDVLRPDAEVLFKKLDQGAVFYISGTESLKNEVLDVLEQECSERGIDWNEYMTKLQKNGQWRVQVQ